MDGSKWRALLVKKTLRRAREKYVSIFFLVSNKLSCHVA